MGRKEDMVKLAESLMNDREHIRNIVPVVEEALSIANIGMNDLDGIAVTCGPGLKGSLLVGLVGRDQEDGQDEVARFPGPPTMIRGRGAGRFRRPTG